MVSSTACNTSPPPTADRASCSACAFDISGIVARGWVMILTMWPVCASTQTSYSWVEPAMSTDHTSLPALVSSVACKTVPPPTALSASFSAACLEISPAANAREAPSRTVNRLRFNFFIAMFLRLDLSPAARSGPDDLHLLFQSVIAEESRGRLCADSPLRSPFLYNMGQKDPPLDPASGLASAGDPDADSDSVFVAGRFDCAVMFFDNSFDEGQTQAPARRRSLTFMCTIKRLEQMRELIRCNGRARIADLKNHGASIAAHSQRHLTSAGTVLYCVVEKIEQYAGQHRRIAYQYRQR